MILACEAALGVSPEPRYREAAERAYGWFLGRQRRRRRRWRSRRRGGCHDGLEPRGVNLNQGAESTLMWLTALEHMRDAATAAATTPLGGREPAALVAARRPGVMPMDPDRDEPGRPVPAPSRQPADHGRGPPLPRQRGLQPGCGQGRRRDGAPGPRRGHAGHLAPRWSRAATTAHRTGGSTPRPLLEAQPERHPEEVWGCEDPRLTWLPELEDWAITYTAYSRPRSARVARDDAGLHRGPPPRARSCRPRTRTRRSSRAASAAAGRCSTGRRRCAATPTSGSRTPRTSATGATTASCSRRGTGPGGTPARSGSGRRPWRPPRAGCSATTASTPRRPVPSTASGSRSSTSRTRASS